MATLITIPMAIRILLHIFKTSIKAAGWWPFSGNKFKFYLEKIAPFTYSSLTRRNNMYM